MNTGNGATGSGSSVSGSRGPGGGTAPAVVDADIRAQATSSGNGAGGSGSSGSGGSGGGTAPTVVDADIRAQAIAFSSKQPKQGSPRTPFRLTPDRVYTRKFFGSGKLLMPDGKTVRFWGFEDTTSGRRLPSPLIRATEGEIVHVTLHSSKRVHTIHLHGIEPEPWNDGVGHTSFEISGQYTYQFRPATAGTYFYHCHVNTVLHVQMGMFGALIVDPYPTHNAAGRRLAFTGGPAYDVERLWVAFSLDPNWRRLNHAAGLDGSDAGLNIFNPKYDLINGVPQPLGPTAEITHPDVAVRAKVGQTVLVRLVSAGYMQKEWTFHPGRTHGKRLDVQVVAADGRPFVATNAAGNSFHPRFARQALRMGPAERYDCIVTAPVPDVYPVTIGTVDWLSLEDAGQPHADRLRGTARTTITFTE